MYSSFYKSEDEFVYTEIHHRRFLYAIWFRKFLNGLDYQSKLEKMECQAELETSKDHLL